MSTQTKTRPAKAVKATELSTQQKAFGKKDFLEELKTEAIIEKLNQYDRVVGFFERQVKSKGANLANQIDQDMARARAAKLISQSVPNQQRLIQIAQQCQNFSRQEKVDPRLQNQAEDISQRARTLLILCHTGFVEQMIGRHLHQFDGESPEESRQVLRQEARIGINKAIDRYDFREEAKPLTYFKNWIRAEIGACTEREGRLIRLKSKANDLAKKVQSTANQMIAAGHQPTAELIAKELKESENRVEEVLPYVTRQLVRLDATVSGEKNENETQVSDVLSKQGEPSIDKELEEKELSTAIQAALGAIENPYQRRVIELYYGLDGGEPVEQKDLFAGVYRDKNNKGFSSEVSVISEWKKRGEKITLRSQKQLNTLFATGKMSWEPGTPEAHELSRIRMEDYDPSRPYSKTINHKTGIPPTSGTIQEAKKKAERLMAVHPSFEGLKPRYRGDNELENSHGARESVRKALVDLGVVTYRQAKALKATKPGRSLSVKGDLRLLAEKHKLVNSRGRLNWERIEEIESLIAQEADDLASLMSEA